MQYLEAIANRLSPLPVIPFARSPVNKIRYFSKFNGHNRLPPKKKDGHEKYKFYKIRFDPGQPIVFAFSDRYRLGSATRCRRPGGLPCGLIRCRQISPGRAQRH
jgi:hypothetical protein